MEQLKATTLKLVAFGVAVLVCAGVPYLLSDQGSYQRGSASRPAPHWPDTTFPAAIGGFHVVNRWQNRLSNEVTEYGALYQDPTGTQTAQFDTLFNIGPHDGSDCYLARGMKFQWRRVVEVHTADSIAGFEIVSMEDESMAGSDHATLLIASTNCTRDACKDLTLNFKTGTGPHLVWTRPASSKKNATGSWVPVSLSITFESFANGDHAQDEEQALSQFRKLMSNFRLNPLRELSFER